MSEFEGQTFGDYEILAKLGQGGMGAVYKARQILLNRPVALKVMAPEIARDPAFVARFVREAAAAANLSHPNMVQVYTAGRTEGTHYIAMEFVDGESLRKRLDREGRLDAREAVAITVYIAQALQYAWNKARLIHRDIKPDNIFLSSAGEVKVGDLGLAKSVGGASTDLTASGMAMGSPHYVSPEQARGLKDIDFRADIYSLGCTLYHTLTGRTPYEGEDAMSIMMKHVNDPPPAIFRVWPQCPMPLGMLVGKMLAKDRNARPHSYEELLDDLLAVHEKLKQTASPAPISAAPAPTPTPTPVPTSKPKARDAKSATRSSKLVIGGAVAAVVLLVVAGLFLWSPWKTERGVSSVEREASSASFQHSAASAGILAPPETRVAALTANPKAGEVATLDLSGVTMELMGIPPGEFMMGSTPEERAKALADGAVERYMQREGELPRRTTIKQGFWLGQTEVTIGQWKQFVAATGYVTDGEKKGESSVTQERGRASRPMKGKSWRDPNFGFELKDNHPVSCISWNDAVAFCEWLTQCERKAGRLPADFKVRLPTEAEWEYACRAGTQTMFWWGDSRQDGKGRLNWKGSEDGFEFVSPVDTYGERGRNKFGLADMLGNVYEWCLDEYDAKQAHEECYRGNPNMRVSRGGSFLPDYGWDRCALRRASAPLVSSANTGFRVCIGPEAAISAATTVVSTTPREAGILAPTETRVAALTANPKIGEVYTADLGGGVTMELMGIPPGEFMMGSTKEEREWAAADRYPKPINEGDQPRKIRIKQGFRIGRTEVTVGQWKQFVAATSYQTDAEKKGEAITYDRVKKIMGPKPGASWREPDSYGAAEDNHPVRYISWNDAMAFCKWLKEQEEKAGRLPKNQVIRVPTEAEWEYACRAGTQTRFWWGESPEGGEGRLNWFLGAGSPKPMPVNSFGERGRNGFGLTDVLGNVREWCLDEYDPTQANEECYKGKADKRVLRDGAFYNKPAVTRSASRSANVPSYAEHGNGFRVCCGADVLGATGTTVSTHPSTPPRGVDDVFIREVAALPAEAQVQRVGAKLKELNPEFNGKVEHKIENGVVVELRLCTVAITDIAPVRAFRKLRSLTCNSSGVDQRQALTRRGRLTDLSPLAGLQLDRLYLGDNPNLSDFSFVKGIPLNSLYVEHTKFNDLTVLKGMPLQYLSLAGIPIRDLTALEGMHLRTLYIQKTSISDLSPLKSFPLKNLGCTFVAERDAEILRSIKTLEMINNLPAAEFWKRVAAGESPQAR